MKPTRLLLAIAAVAGAAALLPAGPSPQYWNRPSAPAKTPAPAAATVTPPPTSAPAATACASCTTCACGKKVL
jgi:hypothetical protein